MSFPQHTNAYHSQVYPTVDPKRPELSAKGKVIVISGGGIGIGVEVVRAFALAGATKLAILGRTQSALLSTKKAIEDEFEGVKVLAAVADIVNKTAVEKAFTSIYEKWGKINVLVANAGYLPAPNSNTVADPEDWWKGFEINVKGSFNLIQAFVPRAVSDAVIVSISTAVAHVPYFPGASAYASSKIASAKIFEYVQYENPDFTVINLHPGVVETRMKVKSKMDFKPEQMTDIKLPAALTVWIASGEAKFLKGKFIWCNWDVDELKARSTELTEGGKLTLALAGWPA